MSELEEVVQKVLLEGDEQLLSQLAKIGKEGAESIMKIGEAAAAGGSQIEGWGNLIATVAGMVAASAGALIMFTEAQDKVTLQTALLAEAMGTTAAELQGIEAGFAAAGVSAQTFERFATRLTQSISQQWPEISASIRTSATEQDQAQERVVSATLRVQQAQQALAHDAQTSASEIAAANSRVETAFRNVQFAAEKAAQEMRGAYDSVASATLGLEAAQQKLDEMMGHPPSDSMKKDLALRQQQEQVTSRQLAVDQASTAAREKQAAAAQKQRDIQQALVDAQEKAAKTAEDAALRAIQLENAQREAITSKAAAQEAAHQQTLKDVPAIAAQLTAIEQNGKNAAQSIDLSEVSVQNLERAFISLAKAEGGDATGKNAILALSKMLSSATTEQISQSQRLALVQKFAGTAMTTSGLAAADLLKVLEKGPDYFKHWGESAQGAFNVTDKGVENVKHFEDALEGMNQQLGLVSQYFANAMSPTLTVIIDGITSSIKESGGALHLFVQGIMGIGTVLHQLGAWFAEAFEASDKFFKAPAGATFRFVMTAILVVVAAIASAIVAWPLIIAGVVVAIGIMYENWDKIKKVVGEAWDAVKDTAVYKFLDGVIQRVKDAYAWWLKFTGGAAKGIAPGGTSSGGNVSAADVQATGAAAGASGNSSGFTGFASGGRVEGPGTTTSDSIFARLSRGEFVIRAAAVQQYGAGLFDQLNNMAFPGFAAGGLVASPVRLAGGGAQPATSTLNLTIGDRTFSGLRGPKSTVDDLSSFAISRQTSAAGSNPSWMK